MDCSLNGSLKSSILPVEGEMGTFIYPVSPSPAQPMCLVETPE